MVQCLDFVLSSQRSSVLDKTESGYNLFFLFEVEPRTVSLLIVKLV